MEKDIDKIPKNQDTDIIIRVDDFGGKRGITIREFVKSERYTGFTKAGTRIPAEYFKAFKAAINSIDEKELAEAIVQTAETPQKQPEAKQQKTLAGKTSSKPNYEETEM
ncbi:MAG: hypothetical protein AABY16_00625 [Nanoarchaeota archaeon]